MPREKSTEATVEGVLKASIETLSLGIDAIQREIKLIAADKGAKSKHDKGSRIAFLTSRVGSIADSLRKVEAARAKRYDDITSSIVLNYLRGLDASERARIIREAIAIDEKRSGLA